jgi:hypothetical protein
MLVTLFNVVAVAWPISEMILALLSRGKRRSAPGLPETPYCERMESRRHRSGLRQK